MASLYLLIPLSLLFVVAIIGLLFWAIKNGQYEDMEGPAYQILMDKDTPKSSLKRHEKNSAE
jgi:cbb3-type cytochrome oxidase maturation protein